ncbi:type II secretion system protein [Hoeflea poritis]|uniref:Type II secretion system protein n=1 Tax=Hoeflea poritis TaxID=2993659 RepID=A0ABT4VVV7_9HYPH|nr:type II secretion system protein [Hoeflea poritis]MDA4848836.1 type II secretion system protein [Hoeflea poritis]
MKTFERTSDGEAGFTLIETIVAFAVISVSLAVAVKAISVSLHNAERSRIEADMRLVAKAQLSQMVLEDFLHEAVQKGRDGPYSWTLSAKPLAIYGGPEVKTLTLEITHNARPKLTSKYITFARSD